jgi:cell division protein FtsX
MASARDKTVTDVASELKDLVVAYARQETVEPLKSLVRFGVFGVLGSVILSVGLMLLALAVLRALQSETGATFGGNLSWAPYLLTVLACVTVAGLAGRAIGRQRRKRERTRR